MKLKQTLILTVILSLISITVWELYWRSEGFTPGLEDDKHLWAKTRHKVEKATENDIVIIGSSRVLFDLQLDVWEQQTGIKPIQLSSVGTTPLPALKDIVENTDFAGTLIVGVTPGLFFSTTYPLAPPWQRMQNRVDFYHNRTYANQLNHFVAIPLENTFTFLAHGEEEWVDDLNLKNFISKVKIGQRLNAKQRPPFRRFSDITIDRNTRMKEKTVTDTAFANSIKTIWKFFIFESGAPPPDKEKTTLFFLEYAEKFTARGGNIILLRCPSDGFLRTLESKGLPRATFWDSLVLISNLNAYHFEDYEELTGFSLPEWSHLSGPDADVFTKRLVNILLEDNAIPTQKTN
jgi:hypothetical protein